MKPKLEGRELPDGWIVGRAHEASADATGGHFSRRYRVTNRRTGQEGYLKVLDFAEAFRTPDPARALQSLIAQFNFERDLLDLCADKRCARVVVAIAAGKVDIPEHVPPFVQYIIFEVAEGDIRGKTGWKERNDRFILSIAHQTASALRQVHQLSIAHQDVKPSNILVFPGTHKIADLGRASLMGKECPCDEYQIPGDMGYAPIELVYGHVSTDWRERRLGGDLYLLGNLTYYLYTGVSLTAAVVRLLHPTLHPAAWTQPYSELLPFLIEAHEEALQHLSARTKLADRSPQLVSLVRDLTHPDPAKRGETVGSNRFSLERFISRLALLVARAELLRAA